MSGASLDLSVGMFLQEARLKEAAAKLEEAEEAAEAAGVGDLFAAEEGAEEAQEDLEDAEEENEAAQEEVSVWILKSLDDTSVYPFCSSLLSE